MAEQALRQDVLAMQQVNNVFGYLVNGHGDQSHFELSQQSGQQLNDLSHQYIMDCITPVCATVSSSSIAVSDLSSPHRRCHSAVDGVMSHDANANATFVTSWISRQWEVLTHINPITVNGASS